MAVQGTKRASKAAESPVVVTIEASVEPARAESASAAPIQQAPASLLGDAYADLKSAFRKTYDEGTAGMEPSRALTVVDFSSLASTGAGTALVTLGNRAGTALAAAGTAVPEFVGKTGRIVSGDASGADIADATAFTKKWTGFFPGIAKGVVLKAALSRLGKIDDSTFAILNNYTHSTTDLMKALYTIKPKLLDHQISAETAAGVLSYFRDSVGQADPAVQGEALAIIAPNIPRDEALKLAGHVKVEDRPLVNKILEILTGHYASMSFEEVRTYVQTCKLTQKETNKLFGKKLTAPADRDAVKNLFAPPPSARVVASASATVAEVAPQVSAVASAAADRLKGFGSSFLRGLRNASTTK